MARVNRGDSEAPGAGAVVGGRGMLIAAASLAVISFAFFSFSRWISAPPERLQVCRGHLCPREAPPAPVRREVHGYTIRR